MQVALLRVLQERKITPIGGTKEIPVDIRVIAATHCDLRELAENGKIREDLFYRLHVYPIELLHYAIAPRISRISLSTTNRRIIGQAIFLLIFVMC